MVLVLVRLKEAISSTRRAQRAVSGHCRLVLSLKLDGREKEALVAYMRQL